MKYLDNIGVEFEENILKKDLTEVMKCIANEEVVVFREQDITAKQFVDNLELFKNFLKTVFSLYITFFTIF